MLYRVDGPELTEVLPTTIPDEALYERDVEDWVSRRPEILGEPLLIIGRQVTLDEGKDRIDLLAVDRAGRLVVIELKRDLVGGSADLQALRYAALVSGWTFEEVRRQAEGHWRTVGQEGTFAQRLESFCDEGYEVNGDQRVILAGRDIKPRLGTMAQWLLAHRIDVKVVSISLFRDGERVFLQPQTIIPVPTDQRLTQKVSIGASDKPWLVDGQAWHMEQRCSAEGREILLAIVDIIGRAVPDAAPVAGASPNDCVVGAAASNATIVASERRTESATPSSAMSPRAMSGTANVPPGEACIPWTWSRLAATPADPVAAASPKACDTGGVASNSAIVASVLMAVPAEPAALDVPRGARSNRAPRNGATLPRHGRPSPPGSSWPAATSS